MTDPATLIRRWTPDADGRMDVRGVCDGLGLDARLCFLFVVECGRSPAVWPRLTPSEQSVVELTEAFVAGGVSAADMQAAWQGMEPRDPSAEPGLFHVGRVVKSMGAGSPRPGQFAEWAADWYARTVDGEGLERRAAAWGARMAEEAAAARSAGPDAFRLWSQRCPLPLPYSAAHHPEWLAERERQGRVLDAIARPGWHFDPRWRTDAVRSLATAIYAGKAWGRLPVLADALEEAGGDPAYLAHARDPAFEGFRGEWLVDHAAGRRG